MNVSLKRKSDQAQLIFSRAEAASLLKLAGGEHGVFLGSPKNGKPHLLLTVKIKGRKFTFVQGDTHAIWSSHQGEVERNLFDQIWGMLRVGESISIDVVKAEFIPGADANERSADDLKLDF